MIYSTDIKLCNEFAQESASNLRRVLLFVIATIQQQLETTAGILTDYETLGTASRFSWGFKKSSLEYITANYRDLYSQALRAKHKPGKLLSIFLRVPGLGIVKAGFVAQIFCNVAGCIDVHNVTIYGVPLSALRYNKTVKPATARDKRSQYLDLCHGLGGSAALWSRWCDHVAKLRPNNWENGAAVSAYHVDVITGIETGAVTDLFSGLDYEPKFLQAA